MAQYFQVLSQVNKPTTVEELRQLYPNLLENQTVQYVITQEEQPQFQNQQVLESTDQVMVVENQPQEVVTQVKYQHPQYMVQPAIANNFQEQQPQQQIYFVEKVETTPVESKQLITQQVPPQPQPVVLNHHLQNSFKNQIMASAQKLMGSTIRQLQQNQIAEAAPQTQPERATVSTSTSQRPVQIPQPRPSLNSVQQQRAQGSQKMNKTIGSPQVTSTSVDIGLHVTQPKPPGGAITEADSREAIALADGTIVNLATYKKMMAEKAQAQAANQTPEKPSPRKRNSKSGGTPRTRKPSAKAAANLQAALNNPGPKSKSTATTSSRAAARLNSSPMPPGGAQARFPTPQANPRGVAPVRAQPPPLVQQQNKQMLIQSPQVQQQVRAQLQQRAQLPQQQIRVQLQQPHIIQQPQMQPQLQLQPQPQIQLQGFPPQQMIQQPPKFFVPSSQLQRIIENMRQPEEYTDSVRMLVLLADGEQRLITFQLPKEQCTIQEILEQIGVQFSADTKIECQETNISGINYIVTVGTSTSALLEEVPVQAEEQPEIEDASVVQPQPAQASQTVPDSSCPPKVPSPEPVKEVPKLIPGRLAVCRSCGYLSEDFNRCLRCKRKLPDDVKSIGSINPGNFKKQDTVKVVQALQEKKQINITLKNNGVAKAVAAAANSAKRKGKPKPIEEPIIVTLSSDDEDDPPKSSFSATEELVRKLQENSVTLMNANQKEPTPSDIEKGSSSTDSSGGKQPSPTTTMEMFCRTIRIGSYRYIPRENLVINSNSLVLRVPHPKDETNIKQIEIERNHVVKVLVSFSKMLPVIFYYVKPSVGEFIREQLGMKLNDEQYFDPLSKDEPFKRITILPEYMTEKIKEQFRDIYSKPYNIMDELKYEEANKILLLTCPKELSKQFPSSNTYTEIKQLLIYPPGKGGISINTEDYLCLASDQFLNDVIIDFYLKYLVKNLLEPEQQEKVHVFSTFFYKRLTTKPYKATRKSHPAELDPNLTPAQKRHARVKSWTKNVNLFEKDFIIIPINENCHWFLAIICFPSMEGCYTMDGKSIKIEPKSSKKKQIPPLIGNVTITQVKVEKKPEGISCDDGAGSDKDEAEGDDSELDSDEDAEEPPTSSQDTTPSNPNQRQPIKQPCILIFDSLAGASRSRVVATLRDYLTCEFKVKMGVDRLFNKDTIKGACPKVPQQTNFTDCGLYLLQYVESFFLNPIRDYHIPIQELKTWFEEIVVTRKREEIALLIKDLMIEYDKDVNILPDIRLPTQDGKVVFHYDDEDEEMEEEDEEEEMFGEEEEDDEMVDPDFNAMGGESDEVSSSFRECATDDDKSNLDGSESSASTIKLSQTGLGVNDSFKDDTLNETIKPNRSDVKTETRDTMSYLKAKRINRHKHREGGDAKKAKLSD